MNAVPPLLPEEHARRIRSQLSRSNRGRRWLWVFLIVSLLINALVFGVIATRNRMKQSRRERTSIFQERYLTGDRDSTHRIAMIRVSGLITSSGESSIGYDGMMGDIREQLRIAGEDPSVSAVILRVDSPGGEVLASDEIYRAVARVREKKKVICSMGSLAASGGYYAAMGSNWIVADDLTITGSIGVIMETMNYQDLLGKVGVKFLVFKSGKFKDILNGSREPLPEEVDLIQNLVMETYDQFVGIVARERKIDIDELRHHLADGRIYSGKQAKAARLVDQTGNLEDAIEKAQEMAGISDSYVFDYVVPFSLGDLLGFLTKQEPPKIEVKLGAQGLELQNGKMYYLSSHLM